MTVITISDDLKQAIDLAFPDEDIRSVVDRILRAEVERRGIAARADAARVLAAFEGLQRRSSPLAAEELRALRIEGRP